MRRLSKRLLLLLGTPAGAGSQRLGGDRRHDDDCAAVRCATRGALPRRSAASQLSRTPHRRKGCWHQSDPVEDLAFVGMIQQFGTGRPGLASLSRRLVYPSIMVPAAEQ